MENKKTEVDIILPNYNSIDFIDKTIKSVLNQSYTNWKLILVDDFSNTETKNKIKKYKKFKKIKIFWLKKNKGAAYCRNFGIKKSKYISYVLSFIFISISFINQSRNNDLISDILLFFILIFIIYKTKKNQTKYFSSFWVESVPVYWFIIQSILFGRII